MDISAEIAAIQAASQGSELRQPLVGALNKLNSGSLPAVTASDAGKILKVGANGWEVGEKSGYMPVPTATKQITENGTHDVTNYASAVVNVSGGGGSILIPKTITQNGTYDPADDNADGYSEVTVNVGAGGSEFQAYHIYSKSVSGADASIYVQKGLYDLFDSTSLFTPTGEASVVNFNGSTYTETEFDSFFIVASYIDNNYNWGVIADDTVYSDGVVYVQGQRVQTWYYSTSVDFYILVNA